MYDSFGHLNTEGYMGYKYPVVLGETGSKFIAGTSDIQSMADIQAWVSGAPNTGTAHNPANVRSQARLPLVDDAPSSLV